ncbi:MAG: GldG family protein [bacterium]
MEVNKYSETRKFKYGINAFILTMSVIGIVFVLNAIMSKYSKQFDLTENRRFSLSPQTMKLLKSLKKEVTVNLFAKEGDPQNEILNDLLKLYTRNSKFIKVKNIDIDKDPSLAGKYKVTRYGTIVFECGDMKSQVGQSELFDFGYGVMGMGHTGDPKFNGEIVVTNNIMKVTSEKKKSVYFLIGHNERLISNVEDEGLSKIQDYLIRENYEVKSINLSTNPNISTQDTVLIIPGPKFLILERELKVIENYLEKGGRIFLMIDPQVIASNGIDKFLAKWGVKLGDDIVIDPELSYFYDALTPIPNYIAHNITDELLRAKTGVIFPGARTVSKSINVPDDLDVSPLLRTSKKSWAEKSFDNRKTEFDEKDIKGPLTMAVAVENETPKSKLVVIGDSDFASNRMANSQGNVDLFMNAVNWLAGDVEKISIRPLVMSFKKIELNKNQSKIVLFISLGLVPLLVAGIGGVIWWKRRDL